MPGVVTVKDIIENFLENTDIKILKNEEYDYIMSLYDDIVAVPYVEYKELLYIKEKYYADVFDYESEKE